ncbi:MAG: GAF domain-containing sensor histidine kinase [Armatimonadetes bacterium]|nr:GAF domain-containing sensor histidine kinase [Anaerolineae bacterium]
MKNEVQITPKRWQEWAVFSLRWVLLLTVVLAVYTVRSRGGAVVNFEAFAIPAAAVVVANLVLLLVMFVTPLRPALPYVIIAGDWAVAAGLAYLVGNEPLFLMLIIVTLAGSGLLRLGWTVGALHALGVFLAAGVTVGLRDSTFANQLFNAYVPNIILTVGATLALAVWVYQRDEHTRGQERRLEDATRQKETELDEMRDRTRAVSEMATTLNGTLNYTKILDTALDIGRMSIRQTNKNRVISMVLLFKSEDDSLYIANSRGLSHNDTFRTVAGKQGLVGKTLELCLPTIGKSPNNDPELETFIALQGMKATLCVPLRAGYENYGVVLYASDTANAFSDDRVEALMAIGTQATIALQNAVLYRSLRAEKDRIIELEENARKALVRDLHDIPTQTIAAVAMRLRIIQKLHERGSDEVPDELNTVAEMTLRASEEIRHVLFKVRPLALENQGLEAALSQLADRLIKTYKQNVAVKVGKDVEISLDQSAQGVIFYLVEEAVNNARKYAEAKLITVQVGRKGEVILVRIADNGKGFDMDAAAANERGSYGMINMRERAELLDGTLKVESSPGIGTTITVTIPIQDRARSADEPHSKLAASAASRIRGQA